MKITIDFEKNECPSLTFLNLCEKWDLIFKIDILKGEDFKKTVTITHKKNIKYIPDYCINDMIFFNYGTIDWCWLINFLIENKFNPNSDYKNIFDGNIPESIE